MNSKTQKALQERQSGRLIRAMFIEPRFHGDWYVEREYEDFSWLPRKYVWAGKAKLLWLCFSLHWETVIQKAGKERQR